MQDQRDQNRDGKMKRQVRVNKRKWTEEIAKEAENAAEQQHKYCKTGKILNDKESKLRRWLEHFSEVLNIESLVIQ